MITIEQLTAPRGTIWLIRWRLFQFLSKVLWKICPEPDATVIKHTYAQALKTVTTEDGMDQLAKEIVEGSVK
jgi:hypothetical protein